MTRIDRIQNPWDNELSRLQRRDDGQRELRQFHTAEAAVPQLQTRPTSLSKAGTLALALGNGAIMGSLLGLLFGTASGVVAGVVATVVGYVWISGIEHK